jgi:DUF4097 and DUF4098 domain-containing protein YvlB
MMRKPAILALLLAFSLAGTGCGIIFVGDGWNYTNYIGDWSGTYDFAAGDLVVEGTNGSITILAWDEEVVRAEARYTAKTADYLFSPAVVEEDGLLSLSPPRDRDLSGVSWTLQVPRGLNIAVRTSNGRISILGEGFGAVTADTSNGRVLLEGSGQGQLVVNTSNGSVDIANWTGEMDITTSNGSITAHLGKIEAGRYSLTTSNGSIRAFLEEDSAFELSASTSNGRIRTELEGDWSQDISGTSYRGAYNGGGASLTLRTSNANIWLHRP